MVDSAHHYTLWVAILAGFFFVSKLRYIPYRLAYLFLHVSSIPNLRQDQGEDGVAQSAIVYIAFKLSCGCCVHIEGRYLSGCSSWLHKEEN